MKALLLAAFLALLGIGPASAQITCELPFILQNGTIADAGQVMDNFNTITGCIAVMGQNGQLSTPNYLALKALSGMAPGAQIFRAGFTTPGDGGGANYTFSLNACTLNSGNGDNGSQVAPTLGTGCWNAGLDSSQQPPTAKIWGAKCDNSTDDTQAFQSYTAWVNAQNPGTFMLPRGAICLINVTAGSLILTSTGTIAGYGIPGAGGGFTLTDADLASSSVLRDVSGGTNPIMQIVTGKSPSFHDIMFDAVPAKPSSAYCIQLVGVINTAAYTRTANVERAEFRGCNGIDIAYAVDLRVDRSVFLDYSGCAINENQRNGTLTFFDYGDWRVTDSLFFDLNVTTGTAFCHLNGSGGTFLSNSVNGGVYGYYMNWNGSHSEETRIIGNVMDQQTAANVAITQGTTASDFSEILISHNNFSNQVFSAGAANNPTLGNIYVGKGIPATFDQRWVKLVQIDHNTFNNCYDNSQGAVAAIWVRDGDNVMIDHNSIVMNNAVGVGPCLNAMTAGISFIQTEGLGFLGDSNGSGVDVCSVTDNIISFAYQFYTGMSGYLPLYGLMAPLCVINDSVYHTAASDAHLGFGRTVDKEFNLIASTVTGWTVIATLTPSSLTALTAMGTIHATLDAHTALTAYGVNDSLWEYNYSAGSLSVAAVRADVTHDSLGGGGFPQFRLTCAPSGTCPGNGSILMEVQSSDGTHTIDAGHGHFTVTEAAPQGAATTFYWTFFPTSP